MKQRYALPLNLQLFGEDDDDHEIDDHDIEPDDELDKPEHEHEPHQGGARAGLHDALGAAAWEQFLDLQKLHQEKVNHVLDKLLEKVEELDRRHQAIPASLKDEMRGIIEELTAQHEDAIEEHQSETPHVGGSESTGKKSKYSRH